MDRSLEGFKSSLLGHDKTTRNDVLEDISISLAILLRCEKGKTLESFSHHICFQSTRFHLRIISIISIDAKFRFQL